MNVQCQKQLVQEQLAQSVSTLQAVLRDDLIASTIVQFAEVTASSMRAGGKLLIAGNGGSAADAQHLAAELVGRLVRNRPALRAIALTTDTSTLTAVGNDFSFELVFSRQVEALGLPGDVLLAISTSGNSPNIVKATCCAIEMGLTTVGFTGNGGGRLAEICHLNVVVPSAVTTHIQEAHLALEHIFCMVVEHCYFGDEFGSEVQVNRS